MNSLLTVLSLLSSILAFASPALVGLEIIEKSIVCNITNHPVYDRTAVFGTGEPQIFFVRKDRLESSIHHKGLTLYKSENGFSALSNKDKKTLFSVDTYGQGIVNVIGVDEEHGLDMETADYKLDGCVFVE